MKRTRRVRKIRGIKDKVFNVYYHHELLIIMVTYMTFLILAVWAACPNDVSAGNLPDHVEKELVMEAWGEVIKASPKCTFLAKIEILQAIKRFVDKRKRWAEGIGDEEIIYLHPLEVQHAAGLLVMSAVDMADSKPDGNGDGTCSLPEYKIFLKKYSFHSNEVKRIAGVEE